MPSELSLRVVLTDPLLRRMLIFTACSSLASGVFLGALPLAVASRGGGPFLIGLVASTLTIWWIAAVPLGTLIDRKSPGRVMTWAVPLRMAAVLIISSHALFVGESKAIVVIVAGSVLYGLVDTVADSASATLPALLLAESHYDSAYSSLYSIGRIANLVIGPVVGATLLVTAAPLPFLLAAAALYVGYIFSLPLYRDPRARVPAPEASGGWQSELVAGLRHLWCDRFLRAVVTTLVGVVIAEELVAVTVQPYFRDGSGLTNWAQILGALQSSAGVCAILAALNIAGLTTRFHRTRILAVVAAGAALCPAVLAISPKIIPVALALSISAIAESIWVPIVASEVARRTPRQLMARTRSAMMFITWGTLPLTSLVGGTLAERLGIRPVLLSASTVALLSCIFGVWLQLLRIGDSITGGAGRRRGGQASDSSQAPTPEVPPGTTRQESG